MELCKEFPEIPADFNDFKASPKPYDMTCNELTLKNHSKFAVLFKVPIKLVDNIDGDSLYVIYTLVGKQWHDERMSAFRCWERAKKQDVPTKCVSIRIKKSTECEKKEKNKKDKDKTKSED
ncbi:Protein CBG12634 [Caenorhabditis briggsae]|uniref:Protein CBG12634 n=1 Tax=Caenorhabditis briggsae TaxID=6238 RepID=A8XG76_CAEBR|nr:Protein CBG12634 [Caenorhabditis briggsae]CAP31582.2 Protein CBG12634 [Caenorhabditis briggsae]